MAKPTYCATCLKDGIVNPMLYNPKNKHYVCPVCKTFTTPPPRDDDYAIQQASDEIKELMTDLHKTHLPVKEPLPAGKPNIGGSGKVKGRSRKADMKKKSVNQLYREL